ncbi:MAG: starch-binding protein, partial [Ruminococcus sp.]|nr:starch-binding protein [Ruminococcus sp.]
HFDGEKFDKWFNDGGDNYMIGATSNKVGPGTIYFRPEGNADWSYNFFTVQPKTVDPTEKPTEAPSSEEPSSEEESSEAPSSEEPSSEEESSEAPTEKPTEAPTYVAYFVNSGKWSKVNAYAWDPANAAWPGQAMTKTADKAPNGADVYTITFKTNYANIIFNDGSSQTSDLKFQAGQYFDYATGKWYAKLSDIPAATVTGYTVYCVNSKKWSTVNCYVWGPNGASWPGAKMTKTGEKSSKGYDIYSFNSVQNHTNCIFNNGSGSQTADLKFTAGQYFDLATGKWYADASTI